MLKTIKLLAILFVIVSAMSCKNTKQPAQYNSNIVKIIKTKMYSLKKEFNDWVINKPEYGMSEGYGERFEKDLSCDIKYFDKYNNVIYNEKLGVDNKGNDIITNKKFYFYFNLKSHLLSEIKYFSTFENDTVKTEIYKRNKNGVLLEIKTIENKNLISKEIFTYNDCGQRIKDETFLKEGLSEEFIYKYDKPSLKEGHKINTIHNRYKNHFISSTHENDFYWNNNNQNIRTHEKSEQDGLKTANLIIKYSDFIGEKPTTIISDGFEGVFLKQDRDGNIDQNQKFENFHKIENITYNNKGDMISFRSNTNDFGGKWENKLEYTYNNTNDWVKILLSMGDVSYLITRDIKYIDSQSR